MAFINELMSKNDIDKYDIAAIDRKFPKAHFEPEWTVDKVRDIYLRWMCFERDPYYDNFHFFWKGSLFHIRLLRKGEGTRGGKGSTTWSIWPWAGRTSIWLPDELEAKRQEIISDLKDALITFKDFGLGSTIADHTAYFKF